MQVNKVKSYKSAVYPKSFYKKLQKEQAQYVLKNRTGIKIENDCVIEEVDCEHSILRLRNTEVNFKKMKRVAQPIKEKGKKAGNISEEKKVIAFKASAVRPVKVRADMEDMESEKCVIEELDCKLSLVHIGYKDTQEEEKTDLTPDFDAEPETDRTKQADNTEEFTEEEPMPSVQNSLSAEPVFEQESIYDMNRYASSNIVDMIVLCSENNSEDKEDAEENTCRRVPYSEEKSLNEKHFDFQKMLECKKEKAHMLCTFIQGQARLFADEISKNLLHSESIHTNNKVGFLSLLSFFGLLGFFTENKICFGFLGFLYYLRYFYIKPDENLKNHVFISGAYGFAVSMVISFLSILLKSLSGNNLFLIYGMGIGTVISLLAFTILLHILQSKMKRLEKGKQDQKLLEQTQLESGKEENPNKDMLVAMERPENTPDITKED